MSILDLGETRDVVQKRERNLFNATMYPIRKIEKRTHVINSTRSRVILLLSCGHTMSNYLSREPKYRARCYQCYKERGAG